MRLLYHKGLCNCSSVYSPASKIFLIYNIWLICWTGSCWGWHCFIIQLYLINNCCDIMGSGLSGWDFNPCWCLLQNVSIKWSGQFEHRKVSINYLFLLLLLITHLSFMHFDLTSRNTSFGKMTTFSDGRKRLVGFILNGKLCVDVWDNTLLLPNNSSLRNNSTCYDLVIW